MGALGVLAQIDDDYVGVRCFGNRIPAGPVSIGEDMYMVPMGGDQACPFWRVEAPGKIMAQPMYYRKADGSFTMVREEACP